MNSAGTKIYSHTGRSVYEYEFEPIGHAVLTDMVMATLPGKDKKTRLKLAGTCRNAFENGHRPFEISSALVTNVDKEQTPDTLRAKAVHLLKYMYKRGGKDYQDFEFSSVKDYPLIYGDDAAEFNKAIKHLQSQMFINIGDELGMAGHLVKYLGVVMTDWGINEVEKKLPSIPLISLVQQEIATGNTAADAKINHAKKLFFEEPSSLDKMRSACETLSYVLEPLRDDLKDLFSTNDVSDFFQLVNRFDIRHNKEQTKSLVHPEQLEWVFYTLLNTISIYVKLKKKLGNLQHPNVYDCPRLSH